MKKLAPPRKARRRRAPPKTRLQRLCRDGASSKPATQRRILTLAKLMPEIPKSDIDAAMRRTLQAIGDFAERHRVSYDYLLCGDLKGLQRTLRWRREALDQAALDRRTMLSIVHSIHPKMVSAVLEGLQRVANEAGA